MRSIAIVEVVRHCWAGIVCCVLRCVGRLRQTFAWPRKRGHGTRSSQLARSSQLGSALLVLLLLLPALSDAAEKPNIVFLMADDMGYGDVGCYNAESKIPTPHMDALAAQGMRFTDGHTPSSVCTPTRYGVLTGRYCWRSRLKNFVLWGFDHPLIEPERMTVSSMLTEQGYATACVGKWHLGLGWTTKAGLTSWPDRSKEEPHRGGWDIDYTKPLRGGPNVLGFDYFFGIAASNNMPPYCFIENERVVGRPSVMKHPLNTGNTEAPMVAGWDDSQYGPNFAEKAIAFLEGHVQRNPRQPFFLYLPSQAPHRPCVPPEFAAGKGRAGKRGDMVWEFDWTVGRIVATLDRLGVSENTVVFVTSDNGATPGDPFPPEAKKRNGNIFGQTYGHRSCGEWRGYKSQIYEGGHRVPLIVRWPGRVRPGTISNELVCLSDLLATSADIVGASLPESAGPDSVSMLPALSEAPRGERVRRAVVHHDFHGRFAIRQGDWKYVAPFEPQTRVRRAKALPAELYDLGRDPKEAVNVISENLEVAERLSSLLKRQRAQGHSHQPAK